VRVLPVVVFALAVGMVVGILIGKELGISWFLKYLRILAVASPDMTAMEILHYLEKK
jgi:hypothetical protein